MENFYGLRLTIYLQYWVSCLFALDRNMRESCVPPVPWSGGDLCGEMDLLALIQVGMPPWLTY